MNKFLANLCCCFIWKKKNRHCFRQKYTAINNKYTEINTWKKDKAYSSAMEERIKEMVKFIDFDYNSIMDLGCGLQTLKKYIPSTIQYFPINQYNQAEGTIIKDFNKGEFLEKNVDICFCSGIFEYIYDLDDFLKKISKHCKYLLCSYCVKENRTGDFKLTVNNYTKQEIIDIIQKYNFKLLKVDKYNPSASELFLFVKK